MTPLTPEAEAQLRVLCEQATAGPWTAFVPARMMSDRTQAEVRQNGCIRIEYCDDAGAVQFDRWGVCQISEPRGYRGRDPHAQSEAYRAVNADAAFIAASRTALPALLDELTAWRSRCEQAEQALGVAREALDGVRLLCDFALCPPVTRENADLIYAEIDSLASDVLRALEGK